MVTISVWNEEEIDTNSFETKEKVSISIKEYIINNWNQCVNTEKNIENDGICKVRFNIEL